MTFQEFQNFIHAQSEFFKAKDTDLNERERVLFRMVKIGEEYGELCDQIIGKYGTQREDKKDKYSEKELESEFADVVITVFLLAETLGLDVMEILGSKTKLIEEKHNSQY